MTSPERRIHVRQIMPPHPDDVVVEIWGFLDEERRVEREAVTVWPVLYYALADVDGDDKEQLRQVVVPITEEFSGVRQGVLGYLAAKKSSRSRNQRLDRDRELHRDRINLLRELIPCSCPFREEDATGRNGVVEHVKECVEGKIPEEEVSEP